MLGLFVALCSASRANADGADRWRNLADQIFHPVSRDVDLPNVLIPETIAQDGQGFIWLGEETGLLRWDGYRLRSYTSDEAVPDGLQDDFVQSLHADSAGRLWIGTVSGGLARYDTADDRIVAVPLEPGEAAAQHVWAIDDDGAGGVWVATSFGLFHLGAAHQVLAHLRHRNTLPGSLPDDVVSAMLRDHQGNLWLGTAKGLAKGRNGNTDFVPVPLPVAAGGPPKVMHLFEDGAGRIWAGTRHQGVFVIDPGAAEGRLIPTTGPDAPDDSAPEITSIAEIMPGRIWIGTYGRGIVEVDGDTLQAHRVRHDPLVAGSLDSDTIRSLFRDRSGIVWVGTNQGLSQHIPGQGGIRTVFGAAGRSNGLTDGDVGAVLLRPDGSLWIGTEGGGIDIFDANGVRTAVLPVGRVFCLTEAPAGGVLVGTNGGLFLADAAGRHITRLTVPQRGSSTGVFALREADGAVWLGGLDDGLWKLQIDAAGKVTVLQHVTAAGLATANVRSIKLMPNGDLAIGTDDGFSLLNRKTGRIEHITPEPDDPGSLSGRHVMTFVTDRKGRLWAGTDSAGISVLVGRDASGRPRFRRLGVADGLPNEDIDKLLLDRQGRVWASTDNGLAIIDPDSFAIRALRRADGVAVSAYWNGSGTATPDGELLFGGLGGLTVVQPDFVSQWAYRPDVVVTSIRIGGKEVHLHPPYLPKIAGHESWLQVTPEANSLAVEFSALDFSAPSLNRYSYMLEGFDRGWTLTDSTHRVADYTNLPPGDYILRLRGSNRNGQWTDQEPALYIRVLPAWFQTTWFRVGVAAAAALAVLVIVQVRTLLLRQRQRDLERQVADRTAELVATQEQLRHFAFVDVLTTLPNRRAFNEKIRTVLADSSQLGKSFALLLIDLDGFKQVNDSLGHDAGDDLLVVAAHRMRDCLGEGGFAARLGGDEFAILLDDITEPQIVETMCDCIVAKLSQPVAIGRAMVTAGASLGAALFPQHGEDAEDLLRHVDLALYEAKRAGRGVWRWYRQSQQPAFAFGEKPPPVPLPRRTAGSR